MNLFFVLIIYPSSYSYIIPNTVQFIRTNPLQCLFSVIEEVSFHRIRLCNKHNRRCANSLRRPVGVLDPRILLEIIVRLERPHLAESNSHVAKLSSNAHCHVAQMLLIRGRGLSFSNWAACGSSPV